MNLLKRPAKHRKITSVYVAVKIPKTKKRGNGEAVDFLALIPPGIVLIASAACS